MKTKVLQSLDKGLRILSDPTVSIIINQKKEKLVNVVLYSISEGGHIVERLNYGKECVLIVDAVVELDVKFYGYHEAVGLFDKHRDLIVYDVRLSGLVVSGHELWMLLPDQLRHEALNTVALDVILCPAEKLPQRVVNLNDLSKLDTICFHNDEAGLVSDLRSSLGEVLLVDLVYLEDALHLTNVEFVGRGVVQDVELHYRELEVHLVVLEDFQPI